MNTLKRWIKRLLYVPKYEKLNDKSFSRLILSPVIGMLLCAVCLAGLTWAWFSDSAQSAGNAITAASYEASVNITDNNSQAAEPQTDGSYLLAARNIYTVTLTAEGDASTGYCKVTVNGQAYYTTQMAPGDTLTFTIDCSQADADSLVIFTPNWMTYSGYSQDATDLIGQMVSTIAPASQPAQTASLSAASPNTAAASTAPTVADPEPSTAPTVPSTEPSTTQPEETGTSSEYTIQAGDTLSEIAERYGTTAEKLAAYNGIQDKDSIQAGIVIIIPPADYEIPAAPPAAEPSATEPPETGTEPASGEPSEPAPQPTEETTVPTEPASEPAPADPQE